MDALIAMLTPLTAWHWLALGLALIGIEMLVGTFDLFWIGVAALATALYAAGWLPLPEGWTGWLGQTIVFSLLAVALVLLGRTVLAGLRRPASSHPMLNRRSASLIGSRAEVSESFHAGRGRVKVGDTTWLAESDTGEDLSAGEGVRIVGAQDLLLKVARG